MESIDVVNGIMQVVLVALPVYTHNKRDTKIIFMPLLLLDFHINYLMLNSPCLPT